MPVNLSQDKKKLLSQQCGNEMTTAIAYLTSEWNRHDEHWEKYKNDIANIRDGHFTVKDFSTFSVVQNLLSRLTNDSYDFRLQATTKEDVAAVSLMSKIIKYDLFKIQRQFIETNFSWNTIFFGEGNMLLHQYNKVKGRTKTTRDYFAPIPTVINQRTFLYNPTAIKGQGLPDGTGAYQYAGFPTPTSKRTLEKFKGYYDLSEVDYKKKDNIAGFQSPSFQHVIEGDKKRMGNSYSIAQAHTIINNQQNYQDNDVIYAFNWFTFFEGKPVMVIFLETIDQIIRYEELDFEELPFITRALYPVTNAKNFISAPYLTQDKQTAKQIVENLALENEVKKQQGLIVYDSNKIRDYRTILKSAESGGYIPVEGDINNAMARIPHGSADSATDFILELLAQAENKDTGITPQQRGATPGGSTSAREVSIAAESSDNRALAVRRRWKQDQEEYILQSIRIYDNLTPSKLYNKVIRVSGDLQDEFIDLTKRDFKRIADVDVTIIDTLEEEEERIRKLPYVDRIFQQAMLYDRTNRRELMKYASMELGLTREQIDNLYPPTADERLARIENERMRDGLDIPVNVLQDHEEHLAIHEAGESNPETRAHIERHILAQISLQVNQRLRERVAQMRAQEAAVAEQGQQGQGQQSVGNNLNNLALQAQQSGRLSATQQTLGNGIVQNSGLANQQ